MIYGQGALAGKPTISARRPNGIDIESLAPDWQWPRILDSFTEYV